MAPSDAAALTEQHRQAQLAVRARALRDFTLLWPLWTAVDDDQTFARLVAATLPLVRVYRQIASTVASAYYRAARAAAEAPGAVPAVAASAIVERELATSMYVTGRVAARDAIAAGRATEVAKRTALVRTSGSIARHVLDGGRETLLESVTADPSAVGWARVTDSQPCYFCLTLAARGAVYKTEQSASFQAHDHCGCTVMPVFKGTRLPAASERWREIYDRAQREGEASGLLQPGENTSKARLNAVRRLLDAEPHALTT